jgi:putative spermidine/putrescine transport system permease protein
MAASVNNRRPGPTSTRKELRIHWESVALSLPALVVVLFLFIYPFIFGFGLSLQSQEGSWPTLANYTSFFTDVGQLDTIRITFWVALPVSCFTVLVCIPLAYFMRHGIKFERLITILLILPMTLGTVMVAQAMERYFGAIGWFNQILMGLHLLVSPLPLLHSWLGVEVALFILGFPFVFLLLVGYMSAISPDLERASRMLGANAWQTFWRVILPLSLPGIIVAFCLNFVANFGVFPTAELVGDPTGTTRVLSIAAYDAFSDNKWPMATTIALVMGVLELLVVALVLWLRSRVARSSVISGGKGV